MAVATGWDIPWRDSGRPSGTVTRQLCHCHTQPGKKEETLLPRGVRDPSDPLLVFFPPSFKSHVCLAFSPRTYMASSPLKLCPSHVGPLASLPHDSRSFTERLLCRSQEAQTGLHIRKTPQIPTEMWDKDPPETEPAHPWDEGREGVNRAAACPVSYY